MTSEIEYQKEIAFGGSITGAEIVALLRTVANENKMDYMEQEGERTETVNIGLSSIDPYAHVRVLTGDELEISDIDPNETYGRFSIEHHRWEVQAFAVGIIQPNLGRKVDEIGNSIEKLAK